MNTGDSPTPRRRWWLPSLSLAVWLAFFAALSLSGWRQVMISADGDPCLHWRIGNWMIEHRAVLRADQFSHTRFDALLISKEWLAEVIFAGAGNAFGWNGAVLLAAALIATALWLLHRWLLAEGCELLLATGLVLLAAMACTTHWLARPHLVTHVLVVIFAWRLRWFERDRVSARMLAATLVPLMWLWTNLHGAFFIGFVLLGLYGAAALIERRWRAALTLTGVGVACLAVSLVNPNGWHLHAQVVEFLRTPLLSKITNEFRSPNFHGSNTRGFLLVLLTLAVTLLAARPRWRASELLVVGVWGYFALHSVRNVPIFALVTVPVLAAALDAYLRQRPDGRWIRVYRRISTNVTGLDRLAGGRALVTVAALAVVVVMARQRVTTAIMPDKFPVEAVKFLEQHPLAVSGEMFNDYGWGGYLMLALPERRVFVDGRNDFYGGALIEEFNRVDTVAPGWEDVLRKYRVGWTILPRHHTLNGLLALRDDWRQIYHDDVAAIYVRRQE